MLMGILGVDMNALTDSIMSFFNNFHPANAIEILVLFALIFFASKVLRDNDATKLMFIYWFFLLAGVAMRVFDGDIMTEEIFLFNVLLISALMLI